MAGARDSEAAGFFLQQSLEKFLKARLISQGGRLRKVHTLQALLDMAMRPEHPDFEEFRPLCERVSGYYLLARYPDIGEAPEAAQVERDVDEARKLILAVFPDEPLA